MSDAMDFVSSAIENGPGLAMAGGAAWLAAKVFGPSVDEVGLQLRDITHKRFENLRRTGERQDVIAEQHGKELDGTIANVRVMQRVLNDATLYDDNVQQTYVAGMLAGSRNEDGSDDRPVYYLSVMDRLTAAQLTIFHTLYSAACDVSRKVGIGEGVRFAAVTVDIPDFSRNLKEMRKSIGDTSLPVTAPLVALEHEGLIDGLSVDTTKDVLSFTATRIGALLFDWAHGFDDEDIAAFATRTRPDIGLPRLAFTTARVA